MLHGGDPLSFFKIDEYSRRIRDEYSKGGMFEDMVKKHFVENEHKLNLRLVPNNKIAKEEEQAELQKLKDIRSALSTEDQDKVISEAYELQKY